MNTAQPTYRTMTTAEMWPEHADHDVIYSEHGRTDYRLISLELYGIDGFGDWNPNEYEPAPLSGEITETEIWCRDCGVVLSTPDVEPAP